MPLVSGPPYLELLLTIAALLFAWLGGRPAWICLVAMGLGLALGEALIYSPLKKTIGRPRPYEIVADVRLLVGRGRSGESMPSAHAANCFAAATICALVIRRSLRWMLPVACLVCFARVYNGAHFPGDVLFGAVVGVGVGLIVTLALEAAWRLMGRRWFPETWSRSPTLLILPQRV